MREIRHATPCEIKVLDFKIATVVLSSHVAAQGGIVARMDDGRVTIDCGGQCVTGYPVSWAEAVHDARPPLD